VKAFNRNVDVTAVHIAYEPSGSEYSSSEREASSDTNVRLLTCHGNYNTRPGYKGVILKSCRYFM